MHKRILLTSLAIIFPLIASAHTHPVISFSVGSESANVYSTKTLTLIPPFQNSYTGSNHYDTEPVIGLFAGAETNFLTDWAWQLGLSYFQTSSFGANGNVYQFADPAFNNLSYQYQIQSRRVNVESKVSHAFKHTWHPYLSAGAGEAFNKAYAYIENPLTSDATPMMQPFSSHTTKSFTYFAGLGVDVNIGEHLRVGAGYRFVDLGNAALGTSPLQSSADTISNSHIHANEFLAQFSYVG